MQLSAAELGCALARSCHAWRSKMIPRKHAQHNCPPLGLPPTPHEVLTSLSHVQAGALVHVYTDGTCLVSHGGVEMGQGLHTKVAQIAAQELGIPLSDVFIAETATDKVANASPTAASASSDLYGSAGGPRFVSAERVG